MSANAHAELQSGGGAPASILRACGYPPCGNVFLAYRDAHLYCSAQCSVWARRGKGHVKPLCEWCGEALTQKKSDRHHRRYHRACWHEAQAVRYARAMQSLARADAQVAQAEQALDEARAALPRLEIVVNGVVFERVWAGDMVSPSGVKGGLLGGKGYEQSAEGYAMTCAQQKDFTCGAHGGRRG